MKLLQFFAFSGAILAFAGMAGCYGLGGEVASDGAPATPNTDAPDAGGSPGAGVDVFGGATTCTSGQSQPNITTGDGYAGMDPGQACISCHSQGEGPSFILAGTVYPTGHEPDNCNGVTASDIKVVATDFTGKEFPMTPNSSGNFFLQNSRRTPVSFAFPYTARVERGGKVVEQMGGAQKSGDCNSCHTEKGANSAPGRIAAPLPP